MTFLFIIWSNNDYTTQKVLGRHREAFKSLNEAIEFTEVLFNKHSNEMEDHGYIEIFQEVHIEISK